MDGSTHSIARLDSTRILIMSTRQGSINKSFAVDLECTRFLINIIEEPCSDFLSLPIAIS